MKNVAPLAKLNFDTRVGVISLCANASGISHLNFIPQAADDWKTRELTFDATTELQSLTTAKSHLNQAKRELLEYLAGERQQFSVALAPQGTDFQKQVWQALSQLRYGETCSYADIATQIARPKAVRAVGTANGANPIAIIVPCHRVIGKNGKLTGYAYGIALKQKLLQMEGISLFK
ncbi:methylated-DNA--[protein]-cysteine S-methyltransferase [Shewanella gelidimarina]|uniref:methylated-DNA--[protein]-cysteine S-methyltransferase n=1 Tax=Shewanella gelidimarina TaxID=56813 RepID=UPI00200EF7DA|nr:methylated-DNA--[protein]-cysteine S-methyltransferase [Shewanella gelidimarina]MCL1059055.1 methylated-DNA--[protein]-cysteine S-methyltransferase [Shewanella gelidimarina]